MYIINRKSYGISCNFGINLNSWDFKKLNLLSPKGSCNFELFEIPLVQIYSKRALETIWFPIQTPLLLKTPSRQKNDPIITAPGCNFFYFLTVFKVKSSKVNEDHLAVVRKCMSFFSLQKSDPVNYNGVCVLAEL